MNAIELYAIWAPAGSPWSRWAKPVLFAEMPPVSALGGGEPPWPPLGMTGRRHTAVVVDLPGGDAVRVGLALAREGYQPVPLFNGVRAPQSGPVVLDVGPIDRELVAGAGELQSLRLAASAPPVFLLDSRRQKGVAPAAPGWFDNRWVVFPQDFPSAQFLRDQRIEQVVLYQPEAGQSPAEDLCHVLLRWQEAGLELEGRSPNGTDVVRSLPVRKPRGFRALWQRVLVMAGLRRNSAGGFGGYVPQASSG